MHQSQNLPWVTIFRFFRISTEISLKESETSSGSYPRRDWLSQLGWFLRDIWARHRKESTEPSSAFPSHGKTRSRVYDWISAPRIRLLLRGLSLIALFHPPPVKA